MNRLVLAVLLAAALAAPAAADPPPKRPARGAAKGAKPRTKDGKPVKNVEFKLGDRVDGSRPSASDGPIVGRNPSRFGSLIRLRTSFVREILASAEAI